MAKKIDAAYAATKDTTGLWVDPTQIEVGLNFSRQQDEPGQKEADLGRAHSIFTEGQRQPVVVRRDKDGRLHLVAGFGRLRSVTLVRNGYELGGEAYKDADRKLWVTVNDSIKDDKDAAIASILENVRREVSPVNVALAQEQLRTQFSLSDTEIARIYGKNNTNAVARGKKLLLLTAEEQKLVHTGKLSVDAALSAQDLPPEQKNEVIAAAKAGTKVTADRIKATKAEAAEKRAEAGETEDAKSNPRNAAALKKFINESIVGNDDVPGDVQNLFISVRKFLEGTCTEKTIFNRIKEIVEGGK